jgi:hypothetical protein
MRLTPSDTVDHVDLNRSCRRPSSSHEERILRRNLPPAALARLAVFSTFSTESSHRRPTMSAFLPLLSNDRTSGAVQTKRLIYECTRLRCFAGDREKAPGRCPPCCQARSCGRGKAEAVGTDHWATRRRSRCLLSTLISSAASAPPVATSSSIGFTACQRGSR